MSQRFLGPISVILRMTTEELGKALGVALAAYILKDLEFERRKQSPTILLLYKSCYGMKMKLTPRMDL